jgi:hypothetical protein
MPSQKSNKVRYGSVTFDLSPREEYKDGTLEDIETWIKRDAARLAGEDWRVAEFVEDIAKLDAERAAAGELYGALHSTELKELARLLRVRDAAKREAQREWVAAVKIAKLDRAAAKKNHGQSVRRLKVHKAKYNTYCNRFFNAVSKRIFQNMRSICGIQHTWSDKEVKRDIQSGEINKGGLRKSLVETKLKKNPVSNGEFSE